MNPHRTKTCTSLVVIMAVLLLTGASPALAQERAPRRDVARSQDILGPEQARRHIERQLNILDRQQKRLRQALQMLDEGQSPEQIREFLGDERANRKAQRSQRRAPQDADRVLRQRAPEPKIDAEEALRALSELNPGLHKHLQKLRERDPERYEREIRRLRPRLEPMARQRKAHPDQWEARVKMFHAEQRARQLARQASMATDDGVRQARVKDLRKLISRQFAHRERIHEMEIKRAERNVEAQKRRLEEARANRPKLVQERVEEMLKRAATDELLDDRQPRRRRENPGL